MASGKQTTRGVRRIAGEITRGSRGPGGEVAWVALLLVVAVLVALASVGGPIWDVLVSGRTLVN